ncbi:MAG TPA: recombinase family protein, partial [Kribbella sp.]
MSTPTAAAIYCRISQDRAGAGLGVERQETECLELAGRLGWKVAEVYVDNDTPSKRARRRTAYERMLTDARAGHVDGIVVWHVDRLTRQPRELEDIIDAAEEHGISLATVQGELNLSTPNGRSVARMLGVMARQESEQKS